MFTALRLAAVLAAAAGLPRAAAANERDNPDVLALLREADAATRAVKTASYSAESYGIGATRDRYPRLSARVLIRKLPGEVIPQIRAEITGRIGPLASAHGGSLLVCDGRAVLQAFHDERVCITGVLPEAARLMESFEERLLMRELVVPAPFEDELNADTLDYEGVQTLHGVECHVVFVVYRGGDARARWYFGVRDKLPRRVDRIYHPAGMFAGRALELKDLTVGVMPPQDAFELACPPDYRREVITSRTKVRPEPRLLPLATEAPNFTLRDLAGESVTLSALRGHIVVLAFWAAWHPPAANALYTLERLRQKYAGRPVELLAINAWEKPDANPAQAVRQQRTECRALLEGDAVAATYRVDGVPTFYVIGPNGRIAYAAAGFDVQLEAHLSAAIDAELERLSPAAP